LGGKGRGGGLRSIKWGEKHRTRYGSTQRQRSFQRKGAFEEKSRRKVVCTGPLEGTKKRNIKKKNGGRPGRAEKEKRDVLPAYIRKGGEAKRKLKRDLKINWRGNVGILVTRSRGAICYRSGKKKGGCDRFGTAMG